MTGNEIVLIPNGTNVAELETSIEAFNAPLAALLHHNGLPTHDVLVSVTERRKVIVLLESVLEALPYEKRERAYYLSKFTVAIAAGLFDGALSFLWNETVRSLRRLVISYDLQYFYSIASELSNRYKGLSTEEELEVVSEFDLLEICRRLGLLTDIQHKTMVHVNYLRNHASAAHPNDNELTGIKMASILEDCLNYAINASPDHSVIQIQTLFHNIRKNEIPYDDVLIITQDLARQPQERLNGLLTSLFGLYCDDRQEQYTYSNIEKLAPDMWELVSEDTKHLIGSKFGLHRKNAEVDKKQRSHRFLEIVGGLRYKDEDSLAAELTEKLKELRSAHFDFNNFYNEHPHARDISASLPKSGIPESVRREFVKIICLCYIGNGLGYKDGVDERAVVYYEKFIDLFGIAEVKEFLALLQDHEFVTDLHTSKAANRLKGLTRRFTQVTDNSHVARLLKFVYEYPTSAIQNVGNDTRFKQLLLNIR